MRNSLLSLVLALVLVIPVSAIGATIKEGMVRTETGKVSAIDAKAPAIVVDAPLGKKVLTIGVTMKKDAHITRKGKAVGLGDLKVGEKVSIKYTREDDRLVGLAVNAVD